MIPFRSIALLLALTALAGCDVFSVSSGDLAPGTFEFTAEGDTYSGEALLFRNEGRIGTGARIVLASASGVGFRVETDRFLSASVGESFPPVQVDFEPGDRVYTYRSGEVEIDAVEPDGIRGTFSLRLEDVAIGPGAGGSTTARGAFYARYAPEDGRSRTTLQGP